MSKDKIRIFYIVAGLLDLFSFYRTYKTGLYLALHFNPTIVNILEILLIGSLLFSGLLLIFGKQAGLLVYYFQFPLRLAFLILTFGFILHFLSFSTSGLAYRVALGVVIGLESLRLVYSVTIHRR